jgi:flagellar assembly factor FliW
VLDGADVLRGCAAPIPGVLPESIFALACASRLPAIGRVIAMQINTRHFGTVDVDVEDILLFPRGILAFEDCRHWVLLSDEENPTLAWLQSVSKSEVSLPVVSPRRFATGYAVHVVRGQLAPLEFSQFDQAYVLTIVSQSDGDLTLNLKAPLLINLDRRLGRQVVTVDEQPVAMPLTRSSQRQLRKSA